jgi:hypothetical protein
VHFILLAASAAFLTAAAYLGRQLLRGDAARHWPIAQGEVIHSLVDEEQSGRTTVYRPDIAYRYRVHDVEYTCSRLYFGGPYQTSWRRLAERWVNRFPPGAPVQIRFNPLDPLDAVLVPGVRGSLVAATVIVAALAVIAGVEWVATLRR